MVNLYAVKGNWLMKRFRLFNTFIYSVLILLFLVTAPVPAEEGQSSDEFIPETGMLLYIDGTGSINIPSSIDGYPVRSLGEGLFAEREDLTGVTLPETLEVIGPYVFTDNEALQSPVLPDSLIIIDDYNFYNCVSIESLRIPPSVAYIGSSALSYMDGLRELTFTGNVPALGAWALTSLPEECVIRVPSDLVAEYQSALPDYAVQSSGETSLPGIPYTPESAFSTDGNGTVTGCTADSPYIRIPSVINGETVTAIGDSAFFSKASVWRVDLPEGLVSLGAGSFSDMANIRYVLCPGSLKTIGNSAFRNYGGTTFVWPEGLTDIGSFTFYGAALTDLLILPENLSSIGESSFASCSNLTGISFPASLQTIGPRAFAGTPFITTLRFGKAELPAVGEDAFTAFLKALTSVVLPYDANEEDQAVFSEYFRSLGASHVRVTFAPYNHQ